MKLARERGLWLFVDEVYRGTEREAEPLPAVCDLYERGVSLGGLAKAYGLAGLRIGWIATQDASLYERMATIKDYLTICSSAPSEFLAGVALRHSEQLTRRCAKSRHAISTCSMSFSQSVPSFSDGRARAPARRRFRSTSAAAARHFARARRNVRVCLLLPSVAFDAGDSHLRIGYGRTNLPEALGALDAFIDSDP